MGVKNWMLVYATQDVGDTLARIPALDRIATHKLARSLFPGATLNPMEDGTLQDDVDPRDRQISIGCFPGVSIIAANEFGADHPSTLPKHFIAASGSVMLHAQHSVVDWFAFAIWKSGTLVRALSMSPESGVLEDIGLKLPFEVPYWSGEHPLEDDGDSPPYPFPFHPLDLAEAARLSLFGYVMEGDGTRAKFDPEQIPLMRYDLAKPWWKFW